MSESTLVKMPHCWKSNAAAQFINLLAKEGLLALVQLTTLVLAQSTINSGSYRSAHVLLNLLNKLWKRDKKRGLPSILSFFAMSLIN